MRWAGAGTLALGMFLSAAGAGLAKETGSTCAVPPDLMNVKFQLPHIAAKIKAKAPFHVVVIGSSSSSNSGPRSGIMVYPLLLEEQFHERLPANNITVISKAAAGLVAPVVNRQMEEKVISLHPDLVVWETGTTDAVRNVDVNEFGEAVNGGLHTLRHAGIDVVLVDIQYSPQTSSIYNFQPYLDYLWRIGDAQAVNVLHRFQIMQFYAENGRFDPSATKVAEQLNNANFVHSCLAQLLTQFVVAASQQP